GRDRQAAGTALRSEAPLDDPGARANPRIRRIQSLLEQRVRIDAGRNVVAGRGDRGFWHDTVRSRTAPSMPARNHHPLRVTHSSPRLPVYLGLQVLDGLRAR